MDPTLATPHPRPPGNGNYPEIPVDNKETATAAPAAAPAPAAPEPMMIVLRKPIRTHMAAETMSLVFREPTVADLERVGAPPVELDFSNGFPPRPVFNATKMTHMLSLLANVAADDLKRMSVLDWNDAAWLIAPFFMPDLRRMISSSPATD
jgi:hypothetical protein